MPDIHATGDLSMSAQLGVVKIQPEDECPDQCRHGNETGDCQICDYEDQPPGDY